eukprot:g2813.t1
MFKRLEILERRLKTANVETKKMKKEKAQLQAQYEQDQSMMKSTIESTLKERNLICLKIKQLIKEKNQWESERKHTQKRIQQVEIDYENLKQKSSNEIQTINKKLCRVKSSADSLKQEKNRIQQELNALQDSEKIIRVQLHQKEEENSSLRVELSVNKEHLIQAKHKINSLSSYLENNAKFEGKSKFQEVSKLKQAFEKSEDHRRELHQQLTESQGNLLIHCRVVSTNDKQTIGANSHTNSITLFWNEKAKTFDFDRVYDQAASQFEVYHDVKNLVQSALYGEQILVVEMVQDLKMIGWDYEVEVTVVEIHSNGVRDLLCLDSITNEPVAIRDQSTIKGTTIRGARRLALSSRKDIDIIMEATKQTPRCHLVLTLYINGRNKSSGSEARGVLNLVDLAGFSRLEKSNEANALYKESCFVNRSLSCLTDVLSALASNQKHIPYRNSKLTYWLKPSLANGKIMMLFHLNPSVASIRGSIRTLKFVLKLQSKNPKQEASGTEMKSERKMNDGDEFIQEEKRIKRTVKSDHKSNRSGSSPERKARKRKSSHSPVITQQSKQRNFS